MRLVLLSFAAALSLACSSNSSGGNTVETETPAVHRVTAADCAATTSAPKACTLDTDCGSLGFDVKCVSGTCAVDQCVKDADCGATGVCSCKGQTREWAGATPGNICVKGNCRVDADCGAGGWCSPSYGDCGAFYGVQGYWCHTAADGCRNDGDCSSSDGGFGQPWCGYDAVTGAWACKTGGCAG
jgi:hypothetical protein